MSLSSQVTMAWGDGDYTFTLRLAEIEELQRVCDAGFGEICNRVFLGNFRIGDIYNTIRLGLIGGGVAPVTAMQLMKAYVHGQPISPTGDPSAPLAVATAILGAVYAGVNEDDAPGETEAGATSEDSSTFPPSGPAPSNVA